MGSHKFYVLGISDDYKALNWLVIVPQQKCAKYFLSVGQEIKETMLRNFHRIA